MPDWIKFVEINLRDGRKTKVWAVMTIDYRDCLGRIAWYSPWRKYCYFPTDKTIYEWDCLRNIALFCQVETQRHKQVGA